MDFKKHLERFLNNTIAVNFRGGLIFATMSKTVALHTLGCKLNFSETSTIGRLLENDGFVKKKFDEIADVYVIPALLLTMLIKNVGNW